MNFWSGSPASHVSRSRPYSNTPNEAWLKPDLAGLAEGSSHEDSFRSGNPGALRKALEEHAVSTAFELGWANVRNGDLLNLAEKTFQLFVTTDQSMRCQQNLTGRSLAILVLPTTNWPEIQRHLSEIVSAVTATKPGGFMELNWEK